MILGSAHKKGAVNIPAKGVVYMEASDTSKLLDIEMCRGEPSQHNLP
tara:strand:- start:170558 stop:170698 length:141 start_codon:yes stop_codon:yes gene_type:complete